MSAFHAHAEAIAAAHFAQGVARLLASPGAEDDAVRLLRADDLPDLLAHLRERLAQARAEGEAAGRAAERADVVEWLMRTEWADEEAHHIEAGRHVGAAGGAPPAERPLGEHDARNVLWLTGGTIKQTNITSPAGKAAYARFEAAPRVEVEGSFPRNGPERIDALVALIRECHEIHSEWHGRLISRAEAEAYVRGGAAERGVR